MSAFWSWLLSLFGRRPAAPASSVEHFDEALAILERLEGGWSDHPADRGGATNRGVTQLTYDRWRAAHGLSPRSVRELTDAERRALYLGDYWQPSAAGYLVRRLALAQFDAAVHHGPTRAIRLLQEALGVPVDGVYGPITASAAAQVINERATLTRMLDYRRGLMRAICAADPAQYVFFDGWMNRIDRLQEAIG